MGERSVSAPAKLLIVTKPGFTNKYIEMIGKYVNLEGIDENDLKTSVEKMYEFCNREEKERILQGISSRTISQFDVLKMVVEKVFMIDSGESKNKATAIWQLFNKNDKERFTEDLVRSSKQFFDDYNNIEYKLIRCIYADLIFEDDPTISFKNHQDLLLELLENDGIAVKFEKVRNRINELKKRIPLDIAKNIDLQRIIKYVPFEYNDDIDFNSKCYSNRAQWGEFSTLEKLHRIPTISYFKGLKVTYTQKGFLDKREKFFRHCSRVFSIEIPNDSDQTSHLLKRKMIKTPEHLYNLAKDLIYKESIYDFPDEFPNNTAFELKQLTEIFAECQSQKKYDVVLNILLFAFSPSNISESSIESAINNFEYFFSEETWKRTINVLRSH